MSERPSIFPEFSVNARMPPVQMPAPSADQVAALAEAMWQLLDDMGEHGTCVCGYAKALARVAYEPFLQRELVNGDLDEASAPDMTLEAAQKIIADCQQ